MCALNCTTAAASPCIENNAKTPCLSALEFGPQWLQFFSTNWLAKQRILVVWNFFLVFALLVRTGVERRSLHCFEMSSCSFVSVLVAWECSIRGLHGSLVKGL